MNLTTTFLILLTAALLEAGGDAVVRAGIHAPNGLRRAVLFGAGALVLFSYGWIVNAPPWDFGRLLGVYVVFFFIVAQIISWLVFSQRPSPAVLVGGIFIIAGGCIISFA